MKSLFLILFNEFKIYYYTFNFIFLYVFSVCVQHSYIFKDYECNPRRISFFYTIKDDITDVPENRRIEKVGYSEIVKIITMPSLTIDDESGTNKEHHEILDE